MRLQPHVSHPPLQELERDINNHNPHEDVRRLGKIKLGITRFSFSLPFYTKSSSRLRNNAITNDTIATYVAPPPGDTTNLKKPGWLDHKTAHNSVEENALIRSAAPPEESANRWLFNPEGAQLTNEKYVEEVKKNLTTFDAINYIKQVMKGVEKPIARMERQKLLWDLYANLARTPLAEDLTFLKLKNGDEEPTPEQDTLRLLSQIYHHFQTKTGRPKSLQDFIREAKDDDDHNDDDDKSIPHQALLQAIHILAPSQGDKGGQWALNAFRNGLLTMDEGSDFMKIAKRLQKMAKWESRAEQKGWQWSNLLPTTKKTPFKAMKFGALGADRKDIAKHRKDYGDELDNLKKYITDPNKINEIKNATLTDRNDLSLPFKTIREFLFKRQRNAASNALEKLKTNLANIPTQNNRAKNTSWLANTFKPVLEPLGKLWSYIKPARATETTAPPTTYSYKDAQALIKQLKTIRKFVKNNANSPATAESERSDNEVQSNDNGHISTEGKKTDNELLKDHINTIKDIIGNKKFSNRYRPAPEPLEGETPGPDNPYPHPIVEEKRSERSEPSKIAKNLAHVVDNIQGAARWKMFGGGVWGVGTKGITATLTNLAFGLLARIKIDLRWMRTRLAGVEIAMPAYNMELMLYSSKQTGQQAGIGATVGPSVGIAELTGGGNIKAWTADLKQNDGVVLRIPRLRRGEEKQIKEKFKKVIENLLPTEGQKDPRELLKALLEIPELSVNLIDHSTEYKQAHAASLEANAGIVAGPVKLGPTAEVGVEYQSRIQKDHLDKTGFLKIERHVHGRGLKATAEARFDIRFNAIREPFRLTPLTLDNLALSADFVQAGRQLRQDIAYHKGRVLPVSFYEIEYQSFDDFKNAISSKKDEWDYALAETEIDGDTVKKLAGTGKKRVDDFLLNAEKNHHVVQTFAARWELKDDAVKLINQHNTAIALKKANTNAGAVQEIKDHEQMVKNLLNDPESYKPTSFRVYERQDRSETIGLHVAGRLEAINQAEGSYTHSRLME